MQTNPDKIQSLPNIRSNEGVNSNLEFRRLYSMSLSQIRKHSEFVEYNHRPSPFNIRWINGYNHKVGMINLNDRGSTTVFYAASNCGILYNWSTNQMRILQGHRHMITCIASDLKGKWLVTADSGPENILIIWDSNDYFPQKTLFTPHGELNIAKVALSADAKYLLTLGYSDTKAVIYWWIWSFGKEEPDAIINVDLPRDSILTLDFNPYKSEQFLLMTKRDIWIGVSSKIFVTERGILRETDDYQLNIRKPEKNVNPETGSFTCFVFVKDTSQVLVATTGGAVLVYGYTMEYQQNANTSDFRNFKFVKVLKIEKSRINDIKSIDGVIVTGNNDGEIHFYDNQMKLLYWVHGFQVDSVMELSFNKAPRSYQILETDCDKPCLCWEEVVTQTDPETGTMSQILLKKKLPTDATTSGKPFIVRDFIVRTQNQGIKFVDFVTEKLQTILDYRISPALALSVHPEKPFVCIGYADGVVDLFNYIQHTLFKRLDLREFYKIVIPPKDTSIKCNYEVTVPRLSVSCLKYSPSGLHLACGLNTGELVFLDPTTIDIVSKKPFKDTNSPIEHINYSCDSLTLALADAGRTVCVYKYDCNNFQWNFIGKHRAHYKGITSLFFLPAKNPNGDYKLISLGLDRIMVEYDIGESSDEYLEIFSLDRMEQSAVPLCGIVWPVPANLADQDYRTDLPSILIANDEHKYKIVNYATTMTLSTTLGPRYEYPVSKMQLISRVEDTVRMEYLLFATNDVIGLQKMPLDGNPWKHVGLIGHPVQLTEMCFREDSGTLFTIGSKDNCMCQWAANYRSVETTTKQGGSELDPYYCLIENGRPGWLFQEIRDLFYYIQILCQGTFSPAMRRVKDTIPIDSLPDLMRALGFFPSEYEVENLITEAKYKVYLRNPVTEIDFDEFVKIYLNHRPAFGDNMKSIRKAFKNFATVERDRVFIEREDFVDMLCDNGEHFSRELAWYLLSILMGQSFEEREHTTIDFSMLPDEITFSDLVTAIMGIQDMDSSSSQRSCVEHQGSQQFGSSLDSGERYY